VNVLSFKTLYPNNVWPYRGVFVKERMTRVAALPDVDLKMVSPVPYYPPIGFGWRMPYRRVLRKELLDGIEVYHPRYVLAPQIGMAIHGFLMALCVLPLVRRISREFPPDIVDAHYIYPDGFAGMLIGQYLGCPVVITARGSDVNVWAKLPFIRSLLRLTLSRASHVISVSDALAEVIGQLGIPPDKISVIPNGVDTKKFYPIPRDSARALLKINNRSKLILSGGNFNQNKGMDLLVKALACMRDTSETASLPNLMLIGEGREGPALVSLVTKMQLTPHVQILGPVPHHVLAQWYCAADLFCLASSREGCPNVILESFACGTPVVATPVGGIPEFVNNRKVGILTDRSPKAIANQGYPTGAPQSVGQRLHLSTWACPYVGTGRRAGV
jgi:teichuronic acid biosynthesis glycosyltransferase TuaC